MIEAVVPEGTVLAHPVDEGSEGLGLSAVVGFTALAAVTHEAGAFEDGEMLGDGRLGDAGRGSQGMHSLLTVAGEPLEEGPAGGIGERFEEVVRDGWHGQTITIWLLIVKRRFGVRQSILGVGRTSAPGAEGSSLLSGAEQA